MPCHPDIVPGQHDHSEAQNRCVEQLLPHAFEQLRQGAREGGNETSCQAAREDTAGDPTIAIFDRARDREHDADDQAGFEDLAKDDDERREHEPEPHSTTSAPRAFSLKSSKNSWRPGFCARTLTTPSPSAEMTFSTLSE